MRYTGTYTKTKWGGASEAITTETYPAVLDAGARAVLGAIWQEYTNVVTARPFAKGRLEHNYRCYEAALIGVAREAMLNLVEGTEHIHTSACEAGRVDCPIFSAGEEWAKENVGEWIDLSDFAPDYP